MNSSKQHAYPGYDNLTEQFEYAAQIGTKFSPMMCQSLLETAETYAQEAQLLPALKSALTEVLAYLNTLPYRNRAEREARQALEKRIEELLR